MANEKRLIDAKELFNDLADYWGIPKDWDGQIDKLCEDALASIENAPTVDAVEVVRCKDCKNWHEETGWCNHHSHFIGSNGEACHPWESNDWKMMGENDFCSYGERKDND